MRRDRAQKKCRIQASPGQSFTTVQDLPVHAGLNTLAPIYETGGFEGVSRPTSVQAVPHCIHRRKPFYDSTSRFSVHWQAYDRNFDCGRRHGRCCRTENYRFASACHACGGCGGACVGTRSGVSINQCYEARRDPAIAHARAIRALSHLPPGWSHLRRFSSRSDTGYTRFADRRHGDRSCEWSAGEDFLAVSVECGSGRGSATGVLNGGPVSFRLIARRTSFVLARDGFACADLLARRRFPHENRH